MTTTSPTLAALLALLDEREPLDVGPCPACVERGGGWEWCQRVHLTGYGTYSADGQVVYTDASVDARVSRVFLEGQGWEVRRIIKGSPYANGTVRQHARRPCPECSEPGPEVECGACKGRGKAHVTKALRPLGHPDQRSGCVWADCPKCDGTGKRPGPPQPTGRDRRTPGQALRDALGLRWVETARAQGRTAMADAKDIYADDLAAEPCATLRVREDEHGAWVVERLLPSREPDPAARDALAVYADRLQARGDLLGKAIALALAGECRECEGEGVQGRRAVLLGPPWPWQPLSEVEPQNWAEPEIRRCPKCNGEGAAVGELAAEILALASKAIDRAVLIHRLSRASIAELRERLGWRDECIG